MKKEEIYIPGMTNPDDDMMHGYKWSEEAKARVREARRAGRTVEEMFGKNWKKAGKAVNRSANKVANKTIYKKNIAAGRKKVKILKRQTADINRSVRGMAKSGKISSKQVRQIRANSKKRIASAKKALIKSQKHTTGRIVKDGTKQLLKKTSKGTAGLLKKADKGATSLINKRAYNKDKAVTTKAEREQIKKGLVKANKKANSVRDKTYKKEVTKNGNTGLDGLKKKVFNKKAYNKTEAKANSKSESARNEALRKGQKAAAESVNNAHKYKNTGDFINKQKNKLVNKAVTAAAAHNVDKNTKKNGGSVSSSTKTKAAKTIKTKDGSYTFEEVDRTAQAARNKSAKLARKSQIADEKKRIKKRFGIKQSATDDVYIPGLTGSSDAYLQHYGKLGMKWGVRRAGRINSAHTKAVKNFNSVGTMSKSQMKRARIAEMTKGVASNTAKTVGSSVTLLPATAALTGGLGVRYNPGYAIGKGARRLGMKDRDYLNSVYGEKAYDAQRKASRSQNAAQRKAVKEMNKYAKTTGDRSIKLRKKAENSIKVAKAYGMTTGLR